MVGVDHDHAGAHWLSDVIASYVFDARARQSLDYVLRAPKGTSAAIPVILALAGVGNITGFSVIRRLPPEMAAPLSITHP